MLPALQRATRIVITVGTALAAALCVYVLLPFAPEARIMAAICATFPVAAWLEVARLRKRGGFLAADVLLVWTLVATAGFLMLAVLATGQVERAAIDCDR